MSDESPVIDDDGPTVLQTVLLGLVQLGLNESHMFTSDVTETGRVLVIRPRGLPWRGSWTLRLEPNDDAREEIVRQLDRGEQLGAHTIVPRADPS